MPDVETRYVTWISRHRRHHGGAALDITLPLHSLAQAGGSDQGYAAQTMWWTDMDGVKQTGNFAFWSIQGAIGGNAITTQNTATFKVGTSDVVATAWYIPGGRNGSGVGVTIDAFDVDVADFVDDDFVSVSPDSSLNATANNDGFVPSASMEDVKSFAAIHGGVPFKSWLLVDGPETAHQLDLTVPVKATGIAFAFYQTPKGAGSVDLKFNLSNRSATLETRVSYATMVDGGIGELGNNPLLRQYATGLAINSLAAHVAPEFRTQTRELGTALVTASSKQLAALANRAATGT